MIPYIVFTFLIVFTSLHQLIQNSRWNLWQDESLMIFVANHAPLSSAFKHAVRTMTAGMPWCFGEYAVYLRVLKNIVPFDFLMSHLEFFLRFPLTVYSVVTGVAVFIMVRILSRSAWLAVAVTSILFMFSPLAVHLGSELRFHTGGMAHAALSWCLLAALLVTPVDKIFRKNILFVLWFISGSIASSTHLYSAYSFLLQLAVCGVVEFWGMADFSLPRWRRWQKCLVGMIGLGGCFYEFWFGLKSTPKVEGGLVPTDVSPWVEPVHRVFNAIFIPEALVWAGMAVIGAGIFWKKSPDVVWKKVWVLFFTVGQLGVIAVLAYKYFLWKGWNFEWAARYSCAGLVPAVFMLAYLARFVVPADGDRRRSVAAVVMIVVFAFLAKSPFFRADRQDIAAVNTQKWTVIKDEILRRQAFGRVTHIIGAQPNGDPSIQVDVHGDSIDHTWQIYTGGPFSTAPVDLYGKNEYGGRIGLPCDGRERYAVAGSSPAHEYAVDFCEKGKVVLRVVR